ncbi:MAG: hemolysin III family protein [Actinobacteria bacterium]|nr:hemolysin III family protein [Actinomycetota bacterium]
MKRTKLADRAMPGYSRGEELCNMVSHIVGAVLGVAALVWCLVLADTPVEIITSIIYAVTMILLYTTSSIYHGLTRPMAKRVFQVLDHCTIYLYIAGTYTIVALCAVRFENAAMAWVLVAIEWVMAAVAITLTAIDLKKYERFSMVCYIVMGWSVLIAIPPVVRALGWAGSALLLAGGISYTVGSILYVVGRKKRYAHSVFHIFVLLGSIFQLLCIVFYVL